jgi:cysteine synthase A
VLRAKSPRTRIVVCEPDNSQILGSGVPQARDAAGDHSDSHPMFRPHLMQGWSPDFIPKLAEQVTADHRIDEFMPINGLDAIRCAKDLARREGIFVGISSGATFAGALDVARRASPGANILCMLPDTGERYLSTPLFEDVAVEMTDEEQALSRSTPGYRFDVASAPAPAAEQASAPVDPTAREAVRALVNDATQPVVMFALEWCEFCWSVRKVLARCGIEYRSVDLDAVAYQQENRGGLMRAALREHTGSNTFPQIFVAGEFVGGCTELFDAVKDGTLAARLDAAGIAHDAAAQIDPYDFLPGWLHPR